MCGIIKYLLEAINNKNFNFYCAISLNFHYQQIVTNPNIMNVITLLSNKLELRLIFMNLIVKKEN